MQNLKTITYNVNCKNALILGHKGEHDNKIIKFEGFTRQREDSSIYFYLMFRKKPIGKIILWKDYSFVLISAFTQFSTRNGLNGQLKEHYIDEDGVEKMLDCCDIFDVEVRGSVDGTEAQEVTDDTVTLWGAQIELLYNRIFNDYINGEFTPRVDISKQGKITTISITDHDGLHQGQVEDGYTPQRGVDFWTEADQESIKSEYDVIVGNDIAIYNANVQSKTNSFNANASEKTEAFNSNADTKTGQFNANAVTKQGTFDSNAQTKTESFNSNASGKTNTFDQHVESKKTEFNAAAQTKADQELARINTDANIQKIGQLEEGQNSLKKDLSDVQQVLNDKMEFYKVELNGSKPNYYFTHTEDDGTITQLNYADLKAKYQDDKYFLYCEWRSVTFIPSLPPDYDPTYGSEVLEFSATWDYLGEHRITCIKIASDGRIKADEYEDDFLVANKNDLVQLDTKVTNEINRSTTKDEELMKENDRLRHSLAYTEDRLENVIQSLKGVTFKEYIDESSKKIKNVASDGTVVVTEGVESFADIGMIGGMSRKCNQILENNEIANQSNNGISIKWNVDHYELDGDFTQYVQFISSRTIRLRKGTYTLSGEGKLNIRSLDGLTTYCDKTIYENHKTFTLENDTDVKFRVVVAGASDIASRIYPMLNEGSTALPYEQYTPNLIDAKVDEVVSQSKNLVPVSATNVFGYPIWARQSTVTVEGDKYVITCHTSGDVYFGSYGTNPGLKALNTFMYIDVSNYVGKTLIGNVFDENETRLNNVAFFTYCDENMIAIKDDRVVYYSVVPSGAKYVCPRFQIKNMNQGEVVKVKVQIEINQRDFTPYTPHFSQPKQLPSQITEKLIGMNNNLYHDVKIYNYVDFEKKKLVENVIKQTFTVVTNPNTTDGGRRWYFSTVINYTENVKSDLVATTFNIIDYMQCENANFVKQSAEVLGNKDNVSIYAHNSHIEIRYLPLVANHPTKEDAISWAKSLVFRLGIYNPIETDISDLIDDDFSLIAVEGGGTVEFKYQDDDKYIVDMPSKITYDVNIA